MSPGLAQLIPLAVIGVPFLVLFIVIEFWDWQAKKPRKRNPLTTDLLRSPGETLREQIDELRLDQFSEMLLFLLLPLLLYAMATSAMSFGLELSLSRVIFYSLLGILTIGTVLYRLIRRKKEITKYNLGLDAEIAVGQELNHLMREGYWVFHDFPADKFNIDHVVVGTTGVFAVETKGRPKPIGQDGQSQYEVLYDGDSLSFPTWTERQPIKQAESQAQWLSKWLSSATGEIIKVKPILAIPGWYIKRTKSGGIPVYNGKTPGAFFSTNREAILSEQLQQRIAHQLDNRCRTVMPKAYKKPANK
jgi:hypothetical protein